MSAFEEWKNGVNKLGDSNMDAKHMWQSMIRRYLIYLLFLICLMTIPSWRVQAGNGKLNLDIEFIGNWFFDKYDVELYVGNTKITTIKHGKNYSGTASVSTGSQKLTFYKKGKHNISSSKTLSLSEDCSYSCTIQVYSDKIEISKSSFKDNAAEKRKQEEEARIAESKKKEQAKLEEELALTEEGLKEILAVTDLSEPCLSEFADHNIGNKIRFNGYVAYVGKQNGSQVFLIRSGEYGSLPIHGPDFQIIAKTGAVSFDNLKSRKPAAGMNLTVIAEVVSYDHNTCIYTIDPLKLSWISTTSTAILTTEDFSTKTTVKDIQKALNSYGYDCGKADGSAGPRTNAAISQFRESRNLGDSTAIDAELAAYLRVNVYHTDVASTKKTETSRTTSTKAQKETTAVTKKTETNSGENKKGSSRTTTTYTATTTVNVRSGPSTDNEILGKLYEYDHIKVYEIKNGWAEIDYSNRSAYVSSKYLEKGTLYKLETKAETSSAKKKDSIVKGTSNGPDYIANKSTKKFHYPDCSSVRDMKEKNKWEFYGTRDELINKGYDPCGRCHP